MRRNLGHYHPRPSSYHFWPWSSSLFPFPSQPPSPSPSQPGPMVNLVRVGGGLREGLRRGMNGVVLLIFQPRLLFSHFSQPRNHSIQSRPIIGPKFLTSVVSFHRDWKGDWDGIWCVGSEGSWWGNPSEKSARLMIVECNPSGTKVTH